MMEPLSPKYMEVRGLSCTSNTCRVLFLLVSKEINLLLKTLSFFRFVFLLTSKVDTLFPAKWSSSKFVLLVRSKELNLLLKQPKYFSSVFLLRSKVVNSLSPHSSVSSAELLVRFKSAKALSLQ